MTIYRLEIFLSQFGTSLLLHVLSICCFSACIQVSTEAGKVVWYSHLFKNFPQFLVIHTVKGFSVVNEAAVDVFWNYLAFPMIQWILAVWYMISLPFLNSLYIWKISVHVLLKPNLKDFEHNLVSMWNEHSCMIVETFFGIALFCDWNENLLFPVLWSLLSFPNLFTYWVQHFHSIIF